MDKISRSRQTPLISPSTGSSDEQLSSAASEPRDWKTVSPSQPANMSSGTTSITTGGGLLQDSLATREAGGNGVAANNGDSLSSSSTALSTRPDLGETPARPSRGPCDSVRSATRLVYEVWPELVGSHNRFACRGRCVTGPTIDRWYNCAAWTFICVPTVLYYVFCAEYLWMHVSQMLPIFTGLLFVSTITFLLLTSCVDPGILPRRCLQDAVEGLAEQVHEATGAPLPPTLTDDLTAQQPPLTEEQQEQGFRWCATCKIYRPPRASHCRDCDNCVLTFDHHCPFVNNCVGQRNYAFFSGFLISTGCLGFAVAVGVGLLLSRASDTGEDDTGMSRIVLYLLLILIGAPTVLLLLGVLGLMSFHVYLTCRGRTTKEALTGRVNMTGRTANVPFSVFSLRGPSLIHARERILWPQPPPSPPVVV